MLDDFVDENQNCERLCDVVVEDDSSSSLLFSGKRTTGKICPRVINNLEFRIPTKIEDSLSTSADDSFESLLLTVHGGEDDAHRWMTLSELSSFRPHDEQ